MKTPLLTHLLAATFLLSACAGKSPRTSIEERPAARLGDQPAFARLERTPQGFRFTELAFSTPPSDQAWINLNSLAPVFSTETEEGCAVGAGLLGLPKAKPCSTLDPTKFRVDKMDGAQKFAKAITTAVTYGTTGTARLTNVEFDREAYKAAVAEAEVALGLTRKEVLEAVDGIHDEWTSLRNSYLTDHRSIKPEVNVLDRSGFFKEGLIDFTQNVSVTPRALTNPQSLDRLRIVSPLSQAALSQHLETKLRSLWQEQASSYRVVCSNTARGGFTIRMTCPPSVGRSKELASTFTVSAEILSRSFSRALPKTFEAADTRLRASFNSEVVTLKNLTNSFITVDAISVYYQGQISTKSKLAITLPPQSDSKPLSLSEYFQSLPSIGRRETTASESARRSIRFGLAVKYETQSQGQFTLFRETETSELDAFNTQ
jgi:hypothetical protein